MIKKMLTRLCILLILLKINYSFAETNEILSKKEIKNNYLDYKSLMFTDQNIKDIFRILLRTGTSPIINTKDNDALTKEKAAFETIIDENNISVYLNSIMYISKDNWALWLNENKITNLTNGDGELVVTGISPLYATFSWIMGSSRWSIINGNGLIPKSKYKVSGEKVILNFALSPNQTYIPSTNKIIEGKIKKEKSETEENTKESSSTNNDNGVQKNNTNINQEEIQNQDNLFF